ncbi:MAG TPA: tetratricopeptide repeat protein, partial [Flavobacteriales bacterium]|nr:tetratricopeptide repeat protein [Flavobacteriales bacterium]
LVPKAEEPAPEREPDHFRPAKSDQPVEDLVDQFLKKDPKITPQKAEFYTPGNVAKLSIADNEDFVSETLAGIYEKQGYYAKAIRVYEKLSLKNPGKSSFFASRIKELEALKNSKNK